MRFSILGSALLAMALVTSANAAPVSLTIDKKCGLVEGKARFDLGSSASTFLSKFGPADSQSTTSAGYVRLEYLKEGLAVIYKKDTNKITGFSMDLEIDPTYGITGGPRFDASVRLLARRLGNPTSNTDTDVIFKTAGCTVGVYRSSPTKPLFVIVR